MAAVMVRIPGLLASIAGGAREIAVSAGTLGEALDAVFAGHPALRVHVMDESGRIRPHVSCFHEGRRVEVPGDSGRPLTDGDEIRILQAVSGG